MQMGEGGGGRGGVPPVDLEMEVEGNPPAEIRRGRQEAASRPRPLSPPRSNVPFKTARGFGNWLFYRLQFDPDPNAFKTVHMRFMRYTNNFKIRQLVRYGKRMFRDMQRLYYLQGLHIIAATIKQKNYIRGVFQAEWEKILQKGMNPANREPAGIGANLYRKPY